MEVRRVRNAAERLASEFHTSKRFQEVIKNEKKVISSESSEEGKKRRDARERDATGVETLLTHISERKEGKGQRKK